MEPDPVIGMKIDECLEGNAYTVVTDSGLRAIQMQNALRNQGLTVTSENQFSGLAANFHASGVPEQLDQTRRIPDIQPGLNQILAQNR